MHSLAHGYHRFPSTSLPVHAMSSPAPAASARLAGHALVEALLAQGVDTVFGVPNDTVSKLCNAIAAESASGRSRALDPVPLPLDAPPTLD